jgi:DNA-binding NtrC family response regulator
MERALLMARGEAIGVEDLGLRGRASSSPPAANDEGVLTLEQLEVIGIQKALARTRGNVVEAAGILGLSRSALYRRLQHYGIKNAG